MIIKLDRDQKHILKLINSGKREDGWTPVSEVLCSVVQESLPSELVTFERLDNGGRARLMDEGERVLSAMTCAWL